MFLSTIDLKNIRKHTDTHIEFADNLNYIVGGNGVGKTTILEAIYYLCTTKSCLTASDAEVVKIGESGFNIRGNFVSRVNDSVQLSFSSADNKKIFFLSGKLIHKLSDVIGKFPVVLLSPSDHSITQGYPVERRKFVDSVISQASRTYLDLLLEYNRTLKQRSNLLFRIRENNYGEDKELEAWNEKLVKNGVEIINHRQKFVAEFGTYINESYKKILGVKEKPGLSYYFLDDRCTNNNNITECFLYLLEQKKEDEIRRAQNLVGPHRDDFIFDINGMNLKSYGSQGQHKTFQTILRFAEYFYLREKTENSPIFLLDDVFGELDTERAVAISNFLSKVGQAFITITDFANFSFLKTGEKDKVIKLTMNSSVVYGQ